MHSFSKEQQQSLSLLRVHEVLTNDHRPRFSEERGGPAMWRNHMQRLRARDVVASHRCGPVSYLRLTPKGARLVDAPRSYAGVITDRPTLMTRIGALEFFSRHPGRVSKLTRTQFESEYEELSRAFHRRHPRNTFFLDRSDDGFERIGSIFVHQSGNPRHVAKRLLAALPRHESWTNVYAAGRFSLALVAASPSRLRELRRALDELVSSATFFDRSWPPLHVHMEAAPVLLELADRRF